MIPKNSPVSQHFIKDNIKGQKIAAALYLVTAHLSDSDPLKKALRMHAVTLLGNMLSETTDTIAREVTDLLGAAVIARLISEKNASIITLELRHFFAHGTHADDTLAAALHSQFASAAALSGTYTTSFPKKTFATSFSIGQNSALSTSSQKNKTDTTALPAAKGDRQQHILSFINERKSAGIKDIALLFPGTSEKTVQRELGTLVASGRITKRGQKRWSVYMAI